MAKKSQKDTSGVFFDTQSNMVMSQGGTFERMKEKISAVRAVVPNKSNNEIVLVLQHFENCVDKAVHAFLEGNATEILKEWNVTGKKKPKKKKKPKPEPLEVSPVEAAPAEAAPVEAAPAAEDKGTLNGFHANGSVLDGDSLDSLSEQLDTASLDADAELDSEPATSETPGTDAEGPLSSPSPAFQPGGRSHPAPKGQRIRSRPNSHSQAPTAPLPLTPDADGLRGPSGTKKTATNVERSVKDLQRCSASLTRYRMVVKEEMDTSIKRMKQTFAELQSCLMDREVTLFGEMDKVKAEAMSILDGRQKKAEALWRLTDKSASMTEDQLTELRADIKHFVSERKYDEDLGKAVKFSFELEPLKTSITEFGSVYHPRTDYSNRSRCSSTSSSATTPAETPPPGHTPPAGSEYRPPPNKQSFQGNRRTFQGPGYSTGQRYNGGPYPARSSYRYQGSGGGQQGDGPRTGGPGAASQQPRPSRGPPNPNPNPSTSNHQRPERPARNGVA
ncbi:spermatogenesis-associated serine-rich protein 2 [Gadus macrocephalus]|uniref:spermatogenesis-associated serine-rich protein 2 n=1 Tax=Gadus macrocephalus TaxID=80720 RepID=UPI0028CB4398|nr:spermatogenesis-associated serine-rich protein 2 [Gadus macrocephalus]